VELANKAVESGDEVTIIAGWPVDPEYLQNKINPKVNVKFISRSKKYAYLQIIPWILKNRKWLIGNDVIHCHLTYGAVFGSLAYIIFRKIAGKKTPIIIETNHAVGMPVPKFNRWIHSRMMLLRDGLVFMAIDQYWNNFIKKHTSHKTEIIPNGISIQKPERTEELKKKLFTEMGIGAECSYLVGTVSMLRPDRKPELYIPVFRDINSALENKVHFILAGDGIEYERIKTLIKNQGLSQFIHLPGLINNPTALMANLDLYVSLSAGETGGISMIEAAMCNVPVVGIQLIENYKAKKDDWVWSHTDLKEVAGKIIFLLQNVQERNKLAEDQHKYVNSKFTSDAMYTAYYNFYKKILNR
jgi:glycosyltransferase involved in cell wall biosynthesis